METKHTQVYGHKTYTYKVSTLIREFINTNRILPSEY